ncbi:MAG: hypothetical protein EPN67_00110 [Pusillimonas sp.]|nr:MAG: hypothetical protein EPN67_00110 [Pusillimonas sp.]
MDSELTSGTSGSMWLTYRYAKCSASSATVAVAISLAHKPSDYSRPIVTVAHKSIQLCVNNLGMEKLRKLRMPVRGAAIAIKT